MRKTTKLMALVMSVVLLLAMAIPVFAESDYTITINNAVAGETYSAYKIFSATASTDGTTYVNASGTYSAAAGVIYYEQKTDSATGVISYTQKTGLNDGDDVSSLYVLRSGVSYTIKESDPWHDVVNTYASNTAKGLTLTPSSGDATTKVVSITEGTFDAADFAKALKTALDAAAATATTDDDYTYTATATATGTGDGTTTATVTLDVGEAGYYFVDTSLGSLCALDTTAKTATVYEKNATPTLQKKISETAGNYGDGPVNVDIGDTVYFQLTVTDGIGTDTAITVHDTMDDGLTLNPASFVIKTGAGDTVPAENYTIKVSDAAKVTAAVTSATLSDGCTFEIVFKDMYVQTLAQNDQLVITYNAVLNAAAKIYYSETIGETNDNTAHLTYANQTTVNNTVKVKTYEFRLNKTDASNNPLAGVTFTLTKTDGGTTYYYVAGQDTTESGTTTTSSVWTTTSTTHVTDTNGQITFTGLDAGTYVLTETATLDGYNLLTDTITVTIDNDGTVTAVNTTAGTDVTVTAASKDDSTGDVTPANFTVVNNTGSTLPSTGGIGTYIFYIAGAILVLGAGIILVAKKRSATAE